ncbi:MAG TPA: hypothetical protein V6D10_19420 [Trichocoleus sp.]|jgi:hypothetical protein
MFDAESSSDDRQIQSLTWLVEKLHTLGLQAQAKVQNDRLYLGLNAAQVDNPKKTIAQIYVLLESSDRTMLGLDEVRTVVVYGLRSSRRAVWKETLPMPQSGLAKDDLDLYSFNNRISNAIVFPALFVLAILADATPLTQFLLRGIQVWIHEFGHATLAWLSGRRAIPLPFGWTNVGEGRSLFVYFGVLLLLGLLFWTGRREKRRWAMTLAVIFAVLQFYFTWLISAETFILLLAFAGIGGEFYLSTLLLVSFFFPMPDRWRWDFWRYPAAFGAAYTLWSNLRRWHEIQTGKTSIPWGSLWGGEGDAGGDMNILSLDFGWSDSQIIQTYSALGNFCLIIILIIYFFFFLKQNRSFFFSQWQRFQARN